MSSLFGLRGSLPKATRIQIGLIGLAGIILVWWLAVTLKIFNPRIIPTPFAILGCLPELVQRDQMFRHLFLTVFRRKKGSLKLWSEEPCGSSSRSRPEWARVP